MRNYILAGLIATLIFLMAGYFYWDVPFEYAGEAVRYVFGEDSYDSVELKLEGSIKRSLFRKDYSRLKISINGETFPDKDMHSSVLPYSMYGKAIRFDNGVKYTKYAEFPTRRTNAAEMLQLIAHMADEKYSDTVCFGTIYKKISGDSFYIRLDDPGYTLVVPVSTAQEADEYISRHFSDLYETMKLTTEVRSEGDYVSKLLPEGKTGTSYISEKVYSTLESLVDSSDCVLEGEVYDISENLLPAKSESGALQRQVVISFGVKVTKVYAGKAPESITVSNLIGLVSSDGSGLRIDGAFVPKEGESYVFFLDEESGYRLISNEQGASLIRGGEPETGSLLSYFFRRENINTLEEFAIYIETH